MVGDLTDRVARQKEATLYMRRDYAQIQFALIERGYKVTIQEPSDDFPNPTLIIDSAAIEYHPRIERYLGLRDIR